MRKRVCFLTALLLIFLLTGMAVFAENDKNPGTEKSAASKRYGLNVVPGTLVNGISFNDTELSGMTPEEAREEVLKPLENMMSAKYRIEAPSNPEKFHEVNAAALGLYYDEDAVLEILDAGVLSGPLLSRYKMAKDYQKNPVEIDPKLSYNEERIRREFEPFAEEWHEEPKDAVIESLYKQGGTVAYQDKNGIVTSENIGDRSVVILEDSVDGAVYDFSEGIELLLKDLESYLISDGTYQILVTEELEAPVLSSADAEKLSVIGSFTTAYGKPPKEGTPTKGKPSTVADTRANRQENLRSSAAHSNGKLFAPGAEIHVFRDLYGDITSANGYYLAGAYSEGTHNLNIGGGICQTTTTLYNACLFAELEIIERNHHSMIVTYVEPSRDAMVNWDSDKNEPEQDFRFRNSTGGPILIEAYLTFPEKGEDNYITFNIIGIEEHSADRKVSFRTEITDWKAPTISVTKVPMSLPKLKEDVEEKELYAEKDWDTEDVYPIGFSILPKVTLEESDGPLFGVDSALYKVVTENGKTTENKIGYTDRYKPYSGSGGVKYSCSEDIYLEVEKDETGRINGYVKISTCYLDGTPFSINPANDMTREERIEFNATMTELLAPKGITWPETGSSFHYYRYDSETGEFCYTTWLRDDTKEDPVPETQSEPE